MYMERVRELLRGRRYQAAHVELNRALRSRRLSSSERLPLARLAIEAYRPDLALQFLRTLIRGGRGVEHAAAPIKLEYARALLALGVRAEAERLLQGIDSARHPRVSRLLALARFRVWDWRGAIPILDLALKSRHLPSGVSLQLKIARAAAKIHAEADYDGALAELPEWISQAEVWGDQAIEMDARLLALQASVLSRRENEFKRWSEVTESNSSALSETRNAALWKGWMSLHELMSRSGGHEARARLASAKEQLMTGKESFPGQARTLSYYESLALGDVELLRRVYFGTPFSALREHIREQRLWKEEPQPEYLDWAIAGQGKGKPVLLDLSRPGFVHGTPAVDHSLRAIFSDRFARPNIPELFQWLFPGDAFNPLSAPSRVRQSLARVRLYLKDSGIPLQIKLSGGRVILRSDTPVVVRISDPDRLSGSSVPLKPRTRDRLNEVNRAWPRDWFSAAEAAHELDLSLSTVKRLLSAALLLGQVERLGSRRGARYRRSKEPLH